MDVAPQPGMRPASLLARALFTCAALVALAAPAYATSGSGCCPLRPQDQVWLVSDRTAGCNVACGIERLQYWRYDCQRRWTRAELPELLAVDGPELSTVIFVHGNRVPSDEAFSKGWSAYRTLVRCTDERPVRFIIWSWPSDPVKGLVEDARSKAARTNVTGYYMAWFIDHLNPQAPLSVWAHSFGARAATGALHLLGGGVLSGRVLDERVHETRNPADVVLMAAALDNHWLLPGHFHGQAISQMQDLLLVNNSCDRLLQRYHMIYGRRSCAAALGYTGMSVRSLGTAACKVHQIDAGGQVGKRHLFALYLESGCVMSHARATLLDDWVTDSTGPEIMAASTTPTDSESETVDLAAE